MEKPRFDRTYILNELGKISSKIKKHFVKIFLLGGSGLTFYGLKEATKDIDVVSESYSEAKTLVKALVESNYKKVEKVSIPYNKMKTVAIFENKDGLRWDIFHLKVCNALTLSSGMTSRAKEIYRKNKLAVFLISKEDIFLFKGVTEREMDLDDMRTLAESGLDWNIILNECINQSKISGVMWESALYEKLVDLKKKYGIKSPIEKSLRKIAEEKLVELFIFDAIREGKDTVSEIAEKMRESKRFVRKELNKMVEDGKLLVDKTKRIYRYYLKK